MKFQKSQPAEAEHLSASPCLVGPTENMAAPSPAKTHAHEMHEKAGSNSNTCARGCCGHNDIMVHLQSGQNTQPQRALCGMGTIFIFL